MAKPEMTAHYYNTKPEKQCICITFRREKEGEKERETLSGDKHPQSDLAFQPCDSPSPHRPSQIHTDQFQGQRPLQARRKKMSGLHGWLRLSPLMCVITSIGPSRKIHRNNFISLCGQISTSFSCRYLKCTVDGNVFKEMRRGGTCRD